MSERRFTDPEIQLIFERATEATPREQPHATSSSDGMTLAELQEIGHDVGISPERIANAAKSLDVAAPREPRRVFGWPVGVDRIVALDRRLSDDEWERLVVVLRETFDAHGTVRLEGSLRTWTNGNLQLLLEPTDTGYRIRMRTVKSGARGQIVGGLGLLGIAAAAFAAAAGSGFVSILEGILMGLAGAVGATMFGLNALRLPSWARRRQQQMEEIAQRLEDGR